MENLWLSENIRGISHWLSLHVASLWEDADMCFEFTTYVPFVDLNIQPSLRWRIYELLIPVPGVSLSINMAHEHWHTNALEHQYGTLAMYMVLVLINMAHEHWRTNALEHQ